MKALNACEMLAAVQGLFARSNFRRARREIRADFVFRRLSDPRLSAISKATIPDPCSRAHHEQAHRLVRLNVEQLSTRRERCVKTAHLVSSVCDPPTRKYRVGL